MGLYEWLLANRTKEELAKELVQTAKENAELRNRAGTLEHEVFWLKAKERIEPCPESSTSPAP